MGVLVKLQTAVTKAKMFSQEEEEEETKKKTDTISLSLHDELAAEE